MTTVDPFSTILHLSNHIHISGDSTILNNVESEV